MPVGDNVRPHFLVSEYDSAETVEEIVETLTQALGPGGFDVTYPLEDDAAE